MEMTRTDKKHKNTIFACASASSKEFRSKKRHVGYGYILAMVDGVELGCVKCKVLTPDYPPSIGHSTTPAHTCKVRTNLTTNQLHNRQAQPGLGAIGARKVTHHKAGRGRDRQTDRVVLETDKGQENTRGHGIVEA
ncbi:uncharacterized protein CCOS01_02485 [Colletotrichum costaricense]|uniref:Uncharacterized protein n=1 Tax=Colletotrichum costaricense TaxID=1209916 RepID=A0AAI9Z821_9PEZI|nr:uncharacterized protein CCOS01_02485 [Colletotrichum costaricense]KAK1537165.1 hypothetical protein CCOS01_02485 [Colletotrichum costaricense]